MQHSDGHTALVAPSKTVEQTRKLVEQEGVSIIFGSLGLGNVAVREYLNGKFRLPKRAASGMQDGLGEKARKLIVK